MKLLFFGTGSIGKKHIGLIQKHFVHEIFAFRSGQGGLYRNPYVKELHSWGEVDKLKPDVAFICNPTYLHIETAIKCAERGMALFIEKPIDCKLDGLDTLLQIVVEHGIPTYVAYPFRFNCQINQIEDYLQDDPPEVRFCSIRCETDLSKWRGYETYSAKELEGGGALLELSHEIDIAEYLFGRVKKITGFIVKTGNAPTDAEDRAVLLLQHEKIVSHVALNLGAARESRVVIINNKSYFHWPTDRMYLDQLRYFFENINNPRMMNCLPEASGLFRKIMEFKEGGENGKKRSRKRTKKQAN